MTISGIITRPAPATRVRARPRYRRKVKSWLCPDAVLEVTVTVPPPEIAASSAALSTTVCWCPCAVPDGYE
jgi:hypothetical protein